MDQLRPALRELAELAREGMIDAAEYAQLRADTIAEHRRTMAADGQHRGAMQVPRVQRPAMAPAVAPAAAMGAAMGAAAAMAPATCCSHGRMAAALTRHY